MRFLKNILIPTLLRRSGRGSIPRGLPRSNLKKGMILRSLLRSSSLIVCFMGITCNYVKGDIDVPLEISIKFSDKFQLGHTAIILVSAKPLASGSSLEIKLTLPDNIIVEGELTKIFENPISGKTYEFEKELYVPDGKVHQIIADGYLLQTNGQTITNSCLMNVDFGKRQLPEYEGATMQTPENTVIKGIIGKTKK